MITIELWREVAPYYSDLSEICTGIFLTPFTIMIDILLLPIEIVAVIIKLLAEWFEWR